MVDDIKYLLIDLIDVGFNINILDRGDMISVVIKYDVPNTNLDEYKEWLDNNGHAKGVVIGIGRLVDKYKNECLANFSYKYKVKDHTNRLHDHLKIYGYKIHCVYSRKNGMRFSKHGENINHINDYPCKLKFEYKKI